MNITALDIARRFIGVREDPGIQANPIIIAMMRVSKSSFVSDETPWCSAFINQVCWLLDLTRTGSLRARSWLRIGQVLTIEEARPGFDIVVLWRISPQSESGHVGFYVSQTADTVVLCGGNQNDAVCEMEYPKDRILGVRRLACE